MSDLARRFARMTRQLGHADAEPARVTLLVTADVDPTTLDDLYRHGDNDERCAILRALPLLRGPARFLPLAIEACRTSVVPIFETIACENSYPAAHFPDDNFNQMVLKAVFVGVSVSRILALETRLSPELARMASDYAAERRAAGRHVPTDLTLLGSHP